LNNLTVIGNNSPQALPDEVFAERYFLLRQKEGRIYTDEEVAILPQIYNSHKYYHEWVIRKHSSKALISHIKQKDNVLNILEVGCGNGWLCAQIAKAVDAEVTGLDINTKELEQAKRVFFKTPNLNFIEGSLQSEQIRDEKFDMIIFASSIQYFPSLKQIIRSAIEHLTLLGEVHILDSPFYQKQEIESAKERTMQHFNSIGFEDMADHYHHHTLADLDAFQYKILHHPFSWKNKLAIKKSPFYWITIKNRYR
jgi:SAM-dependent methyltransferase